MYELTAKGQEELDRYADSTEEDLRLTRRTLMYPVLEEIAKGNNRLNKDISVSVGLTPRETGGLLAVMGKLGYLTVVPPGPEASKDELRYYNRYLLNKRYFKKPKSREVARQEEARSKERYPEATMLHDDLRHAIWQTREHRKTYLANRENNLEYSRNYRKSHKKELQEYERKRYQKRKLERGF